ncbi:MAG: hypothetical protein R3E66_03320 [bacterium]
MISTSPTFTAYLEKEQVSCRVTANDGRVDGNTETSPVLTAPLRTLISAATSHTCIRTREGAVKCWGDNSYFRLGTTQPGQILTPVTPPGLESNVDGIYAGERHTCVLQDDAVKCWGDGGDGVAGLSQTHFSTPQVMLEGNIKAVVSGNNHVCAIQGSALKCWGLNYFGQLGISAQYRSFDGVAVPTVVTGMGAGVSAVSAGSDHTCAIQNGALYCWGSNGFGALGTPGETNWTNEPIEVLSAPVTHIYAGGDRSCATHDGVLKCWGSNYDGEVGTMGLPSVVRTPTEVTVVDGPFDDVMLGTNNTCVQKADAVQCWGSSEDGQLKTAGNSVPPQVMISSGATAFGLGSMHMCGERLGVLSCWGGNLFGQTGDPTTAGSFAPDRTPYEIMY